MVPNTWRECGVILEGGEIPFSAILSTSVFVYWQDVQFFCFHVTDLSYMLRGVDICKAESNNTTVQKFEVRKTELSQMRTSMLCNRLTLLKCFKKGNHIFS